MARPKKVKPEPLTPWLFGGVPFTTEMIGKNRGFVYCITFIPTGQKYIGKKFFWSKTKDPGKKRRTTKESDWKHYWSSSDTIKSLLKEHGELAFKREMVSVHTLDRDVNYCEVRLQWTLNVLEELDADGNRVYLNENIGGKFFPHLYIGWQNRSMIA